MLQYSGDQHQRWMHQVRPLLAAIDYEQADARSAANVLEGGRTCSRLEGPRTKAAISYDGLAP